MLNPVLSLLTIGLLAIHQYIPTENTDYIQYFDDVREVEVSNIFPAANQSCLYLSSIFIDVGLEKTTGDLANTVVGNFLRENLQNLGAIESFLNILSSDEYAERIRDYGLEPEEAIDFLKKICNKNFSPLDFSYKERQTVIDLIQKEVHVLSPEDLDGLGNFNYFGTTPIFDRNGKLMTALNPKKRDWLSYNEIPKSLILAILAAEDRRFFIHKGSDEIAISRIAKQMLGNERATGGSTLTMQLLKNMYFQFQSSEVSFFQKGTGAVLLRKVREWYWAKPFESHFETADLFHKKQILEHYFNLISFGPNIQGVEQASQVYFSKPAKDMTLVESAFIVTLLKAPNRYSRPINYEALTKPRRNDYVLHKMGELCEEIHQSQFLSSQRELRSFMKDICKQGRNKITRELIEREKESPLPLWEGVEFVETHTSVIPIQRQIRNQIKKIDFNASNRSKKLEIQTTIDADLQKKLFEVMRNYLDEYDSQTESLNEVEPIKKPNGDKLRVIADDIPYHLRLKLERLTGSLERGERQWFYSIQLNPEAFSFDVESVRSFLSEVLVRRQINITIQNIQARLDRKLSQVGSLLFIALEKTGNFSIYNLNEVLDRSSFSSERWNQSSQDLSFNEVQNSIYERTLNRIYQNRARDHLEPVVYLGGTAVLNRSLERLALITEHQSHLSSNYKFGDFFWVAKEGSLYKLQGDKLQAAALIMKSKSGEILASFDGYNTKNNYFFRSSQAKRQTGSVLKPFTYLYALDRKDFHPQSTLNNEFVSIAISETQSDYSPRNHSERYEGPLSLSQALTHSQNIATVSLIQDERWGSLGWQSHINELMTFYKSLGLYKNHNQKLYPSFLLGSEEETLSQVVSSYSFFANGYYVIAPYFIQNISNYQGQNFRIGEALNTHLPFLTKPSSLFQIRSLMLQVTNIGTAARLYNLPYNLQDGAYRSLCYNNVLKANQQSCFAGKTGTSNDRKDLWFVGFSEDFIIGIWVGYDIKKRVAWKSSKLASIFQSIVEEGHDHLPPVKPLLTPEEVPFSLESREVFGDRACSNPVDEEENFSYIIWTEKNSENIRCEKEEELSEYGDCVCHRALKIERDSRGNTISETEGYSLDITYQGFLHENIEFFTSLDQCERDKFKFIDSRTRVRLCQ